MAKSYRRSYLYWIINIMNEYKNRFAYTNVNLHRGKALFFLLIINHQKMTIQFVYIFCIFWSPNQPVVAMSSQLCSMFFCFYFAVFLIPGAAGVLEEVCSTTRYSFQTQRRILWGGGARVIFLPPSPLLELSEQVSCRRKRWKIDKI